MSQKIINIVKISMNRLLAATRLVSLETPQPYWVLCCRVYSTNHKKVISKQHEVFQRILQQKKNRLKERRQIILQDITATKNKMKEKKDRIRESGHIIMQDIKETRDKMKERMEEVIEVDGWIARTFKSQASKMGSFLDPMADKILIATLFLSLTYMDFIPVVLTGGIILRDLVLVAAAFYVRYKSLPQPRTLSRYFDVTLATAQLSPTAISKWNTGMQLVLVASTLAAPVFDYADHPVLHVMWYITAGTTLASAVSYMISKNTYKFLKPKKKC